MARIVLRTATGAVTRPAATSTLLGRHAACTWALPDDTVPLYWLELRWVRGWAWRPLAAPDQTRGPGRPLPGGWRSLPQGGQVHGPGGVVVELLESGAPERFLVDLETGEVHAGPALDDHLEDRADGAWPLDAERLGPRLRALEDGQVFHSGTRILRFHDGDPPSTTTRCRVSLASARCSVHLLPRGESWAAQLVEGDAEVEVEAECVRVLVPYVEARLEDLPRDGWLELDAAFDAWLERGGRACSVRERIAQDRSRLCRALTEAGVGAAATLFETRRRGDGWVTRVSLEPARLSLDD